MRKGGKMECKNKNGCITSEQIRQQLENGQLEYSGDCQKCAEYFNNIRILVDGEKWKKHHAKKILVDDPRFNKKIWDELKEME